MDCQPDTVSYALNIAGEIVSTDESLCRDLVSRGASAGVGQTGMKQMDEIPDFVKALTKIMTVGNTNLRQKTLWVISNIVVNSVEDAQCILHTTNLFNWILSSLRDPVQSLKQEALWVFCNTLQTLSQNTNDVKEIVERYELEACLLLGLQENW